MKIRDVVGETRYFTKGMTPVIIHRAQAFVDKYNADIVVSRKSHIDSAINSLDEYYNKGTPLPGKLKVNENSDNKFHYHIGHPDYIKSPNGQYSTSFWFILFTITVIKGTLFVILYDYDNHSRDVDWNS